MTGLSRSVSLPKVDVSLSSFPPAGDQGGRENRDGAWKTDVPEQK